MTRSATIRWAAGYDVLTWLISLGRERRMRARMLAPLHLRPGETVLDVGCGTGTLALHARRLVGPTGFVAGIDAAHEMVARARRKAGRAGLSVHFELASADSLPFPNASFDVVMCTVTLHHLPRWMRAATLGEMRRVLKPGGRVLLVDFVFGKRRTVAGLLHHHSGLTARDFEDLVTNAGMRVETAGPLGMWDMYFVVAHN